MKMEYKFNITHDDPSNHSGLTQNDNDGKVHSSKMG